MDGLLLSPPQASACCGLSVSYLARLRQDGDKRRPGLPVGPRFCRVGKKIGYRPADLEAWVSGLTERPVSVPVVKRGRPTKAMQIARRAGEA